MANVVVLGAQWGDEGKGKIVDLIAARFDLVARSSGGHNAGHTVKVGDQRFALSLIPSGILRGKRGVIGNGLVVDPAALLNEIDKLEKLGVEVSGRLVRQPSRARDLPLSPHDGARLGEARTAR